MTHRNALAGSTAILIAFSSPSFADVTAAEVWANWKSAAEAMGQTISADEAAMGGKLTLSNVTFAMKTPEVTVSGAIDMIEFAENGDGTVNVAMSPAYTMTIDIDAEDAEDGTITVLVGLDGVGMTASGSPDAIAYDFSAGAMTFDVTDVVIEDKTIEMLAKGAITGMSGTYLVSGGDKPTVTTDFKAAGLTVDFDMNAPDGGDGRMTASLSYADLVAASEGSVMMMADAANLSAMLAEGMATATRASFGPTKFMFDFHDGGDAFKMDGAADGGAINVGLSADAIDYAVSQKNLALVMSGSEIPLPEISAQFGEIGFGVKVPAARSDEAKDFGFNLKLVDFSVSDMIWMMADPTGQLPHDPATLILDLTGKANWLVDIFDPEAAAAMDAEMPAELHALDINDMTLKIAGTHLSGNGAFTFDNSDLVSFDGMPAPTGALDLKLEGGNGLMDKLVAMGLLPEDQAMGARMMLGMFARPGDGPDTLVSKIEVDGASGAISANGQRLK